MNRQIQSRFALLTAVTVLAGLAVWARLPAEDKPAGKPETPPVAVKPKPLSDQVKKGLAYLINQQHANGGWGQGGGWRVDVKGNAGGRVEGANVEDPPDVASTAIATLALIRAGHTPQKGEYAKNVARAVQFICSHIEKADKDSLYITSVRGTQVQSKIGPYVDTFLATLVLSELKGKMPDDDNNKQLLAALTKTVGKIEKHQKEDGTFVGNQAWASVFSQGLASKGLNRAAQNGVMVQPQALARAEKNANASFDEKTGEFKGAAVASGVGVGAGRAALPTAGFVGGFAGGSGGAVPGRTEPVGAKPTRPLKPGEGDRIAAAAASAPTDAGVTIYGLSNQLGAQQEAINTGQSLKREARQVLENKTATKEQKAKAQEDLSRVDKLEKAQQAAVSNVVKQLDDKGFIQGFGSNGGEEFLSYMNLSETLVVKGGAEWAKWDKQITDNLNRIQDKDGSWSGQHCITGKTFCTSSALLVLLADRAPVPAACKDKK